MALKVRDLMSDDVISMRGNARLGEVYDQMVSGSFRHVPIVDEDDEIVGLLSHRDLVALFGDQNGSTHSRRAKRVAERTAQSVMVRSLETISPDEDLATAAELMFENKLGCLPVVEGRHLVGILTEADFVRLVAGWQGA